ncbi:MAG: hypothetical protein GAK28_04919 [Luteibacter sp.]|uniref:hypothetical protein n=1 Tax=Luteibacter sp. TaxID=1886636 RepID=UPI00137CCB24|nr:hypothetical protein [Luteibacter sp.]KAF1003118.1 MAG: hypothetical protein GAK28_04919 [Luteibacter sp.]
MADLTDALNAVVGLLAQAIYPNGTAQPSATGDPVVIYPGWPQASQLDKDLAGFANGQGGRVHISVFPQNGETLVPAYSNVWTPLSQQAATVTLSVAGQNVTLGGAAATNQVVAIVLPTQAFTYAVQAGDTLTSIATALAAIIPGAVSNGPVLTLPAGAQIVAARAGGIGTLQREVQRRKRPVQVTIWADTPERRTAVARVIDPILAAAERVDLPDLTSARLVYQTSHEIDATQKSNLYRRDIIYTAEYAVTQTSTATEVVVVQENIALGVVGATAPAGTKTIFQ